MLTLAGWCESIGSRAFDSDGPCDRRMSSSQADSSCVDPSAAGDSTRLDQFQRDEKNRTMTRPRACSTAAGPSATEEEILSRLDRTPEDHIIPSDEDFEAVRDAA